MSMVTQFGRQMNMATLFTLVVPWVTIATRTAVALEQVRFRVRMARVPSIMSSTMAFPACSNAPAVPAPLAL